MTLPAPRSPKNPPTERACARFVRGSVGLPLVGMPWRDARETHDGMPTSGSPTTRPARASALTNESRGFRIGAILATLLLGTSATSSFAQRGDAFDTKLLPPAEEHARFHVPPGFEIQLVAAEPDIQKPMNLAFDSAGRLWVTGSKLYPWPAKRDALGEPIASFDKNWDDNPVAFRPTATPPEPAEHGVDAVRVLSDFDPTTGRARKVTVFADGLNIPIGVLPLPRAPGAKGDTALVFSIPAIWRLSDTDGDGRADVREKLYDGFGFKDTHGMSSSYWLWFDGWVYGTHGFNNVSEVRDRNGNITKLTSGNTYRFRPDGARFELFVRGQTNPFGLAFDARGDLFTADSHSKPVYLLIPGGYYEGIGPARDHDGLGYGPAITTDDHGSSAIAGLAHYSATQFPREFRDNLFNGNPVTRRINRARLDWRGSTPHAARQADFLTSDDPAFRPVQVKLGPDGALWIADFYNPIIGHYEVPLTHPARDTTHGRIWRIVWRGLDGSVASPALPNLTKLNPTALVAKLSDPNLVVRSLAAAELVARKDAAAAAPALQAAASKLIAGSDPHADETPALPILLALEQLGRAEDALLQRALTRPDSDVALAALRVLATRATLPANGEELLASIVGRVRPPGAPSEATSAPSAPDSSHSARPAVALYPAAPGHAWRAIADILRRHPQPWGAPLLLTMQARLPVAKESAPTPTSSSATPKETSPDSDPELTYALRLALKTHALDADLATLRSWTRHDKTSADRVADVCLAVTTPAAAEFLLGYLESSKFAGARAGDFARHAVQQLPSGQFEKVLPLMRSLARAPLAQRIAFAEGLAKVAAKKPSAAKAEASNASASSGSQHDKPVPRRDDTDSTSLSAALPPEVETWMRDELVAAVDDTDTALALRAINALKPLPFSEKVAPLRAVALDSKLRESNRSAALRALTPEHPETEDILITVLAGNGPLALRKTAAELLGSAQASSAARAALAAAYAGAPAELALTLTTALAKSDAGAAELLDLASSGRVRPTLLRHRYVVVALEKRPSAIRDRVAKVTAGLPPEDARLDALIAQRVSAASTFKTDASRGAPVFATHCASCHRFRDQGGTLGPSLDGLESRSVARVIEDILDPSRNIDPAFQLTTVTLKNGETKSGLNPRDQADRLVLTEPGTGQELALARSEIAETATSAVSAMPPAFETALSEQEFFDLLEFLRRPAK